LAALSAILPSGQADPTKNGGVTGRLLVKTHERECGDFDNSGSGFSVIATHHPDRPRTAIVGSDGAFDFPPLPQIPNREFWIIQPDFDRKEYRLVRPGKAKPVPGAHHLVNPIPICLVELPPSAGAVRKNDLNAGTLTTRRSGGSLLRVAASAFRGFASLLKGGAGAQEERKRLVRGSLSLQGTKAADATVRVFGLNLDTGESTTLGETRADPATGAFSVPIEVSPDYSNYVVLVEGPGFERSESLYRLSDLEDSLIIDLQTLEESAATPEPPQISIDPARRSVYSPEELSGLPFPRSRSFDTFALLSPGVALPPETAGTPGPGIAPGVGTAGQFSANGLRSRANNFSLDGSDNNDEETGVRRQGFLFVGPQSVETIREMQVLTALPDTRFGRNLGAQVNAQSHTGGDEFHGVVYGFLSDRRLNARDYFNPASGSAAFELTTPLGAAVLLDGVPLQARNIVGRENPHTRTTLGATMGGPGPLRSNLTLAFEFQQLQAQGTHHFAVPAAEDRGLREAPAGVQVGGPVYPATIPGDAVFSLLPFPNNPLGPFGRSTYSEMLPSTGRGAQFAAKLDRRTMIARIPQAFSGRLNYSDEASTIPVTGEALDSSIRPDARIWNAAFFVTTDITARWTNSFRFSYGAGNNDFGPSRSPLLKSPSQFPNEPFLLNRDLVLNVSTTPGRPEFVTASKSEAWFQFVRNVNPGIEADLVRANLPVDADRITGPVGELHIAGYSPAGVDATRFPQKRANGTFQIGDLATILFGRHHLQGGFEYWRIRLNSTARRNARPRVVFAGQIAERLTDSTVNAPDLSATDAVAIGTPTALYHTLETPESGDLELRRSQVDLFGHHQWRITANFQLSAGLRLMFNRLPKSEDNRFRQDFNDAEFDKLVMESQSRCAPDSLSGQTCEAFLASLRRAFASGFQRIFAADGTSIDPRVGFAWTWGSGATVIRGGAGRYTAQFPAIVLTESRSSFPRYLPLTITAFPTNGFYLNNMANPYDCTRLNTRSPCDERLLQPGTLNALNANDAGDPMTFFLRELGTVASLSPTQPGDRLKNSYALHYSLTLQRALSPNHTASVAYVGTGGRRLLRVETPDATSVASMSLAHVGRFHTTPFNSEGAGPFPVWTGYHPFRPEGVPGINRTLFRSNSSSSYHSLQIEARGRAPRRRLFYGSAFTYGHAIDTASDFFDTAGNYALPQNSRISSERGDAAFDARLRWVTHILWTLPSLWKQLGDWNLSAIYTAQTSQPFTVNSALDVNRDGNLTDRLDTVNGILEGPFPGDRAAKLRLAEGVDPRSLLSQRGLNTDRQACLTSTICDGRVGRNIFRSWGLHSLDVAAGKRFHIGDRSLIVRADAFNLLNRTHFAIPVRVLESPAFGRSVRTLIPNRAIQLGMKLIF
jgi:hypothetical protein